MLLLLEKVTEKHSINRIPLPYGNPTWQENIPIFNRKYIFSGSIFHRYVNLGVLFKSKNINRCYKFSCRPQCESGNWPKTKERTCLVLKTTSWKIDGFFTQKRRWMVQMIFGDGPSTLSQMASHNSKITRIGTPSYHVLQICSQVISL